MTYHRGQYLQSSIYDLFFVRYVYPKKNLIRLWSYTAGQEILWRLSAIKTAGYVVATAGDGLRVCPPRRSTKRCKLGHFLGGDNLYVDPRGQQYCRICRKARRKTRAQSMASATPPT